MNSSKITDPRFQNRFTGVIAQRAKNGAVRCVCKRFMAKKSEANYKCSCGKVARVTPKAAASASAQ